MKTKVYFGQLLAVLEVKAGEKEELWGDPETEIPKGSLRDPTWSAEVGSL